MPPPTLPGPYSETVSTEFRPPKGFWTLSLALGSGSHLPSTTKRYSCLPGPRLRSPFHRPLPSGANGVVSGFHPLKEPATYTCLAAGSTSWRATRAAWRDSAFALTGCATAGAAGFMGAAGFAGTGFAGTGATASTLTDTFFLCLVIFIININNSLASDSFKTSVEPCDSLSNARAAHAPDLGCSLNS